MIIKQVSVLPNLYLKEFIHRLGHISVLNL